MADAAFVLPGDRELLSLLEPLPLGRPIRLVARVPHVYQSSATMEVLDLEFEGGRRRELLCKYGGMRREPGDHRCGVAYEGRVYMELLAHATVGTVDCYGISRIPCSNVPLLLLEFAADAVRLTQSPRGDALVDAARWLGRFHAELARCLERPIPAWLRRHQRGDFLRRTARARRVAQRLGCAGKEFEDSVACFEASLGCLLEGQRTLVHGEYYPKNLLVRDAAVLPVDWESAAAGPGEIDLATLTIGWGDECTRLCEKAYVAARWPAGPPRGFRRRLLLARMYARLCWLEGRQQVDELRGLAAHLAR